MRNVADVKTLTIATATTVASLVLAPVAYAEPGPELSSSPSPSGSTSPTTSPSASVTTCTSTAANDLNNDGESDVVIAQPKAGVRGQQGAGAVDVRVSNGGSIRLTASSLGVGEATAAARFGQSVAIGDLNRDCYADILIGVPRHNGSTGRVVFVPGSANGVNQAGAEAIDITEAKTGDRFGQAIAIGNNTAYISAPYADETGAKNVGRVYIVGLAAKTFTVAATLQQGVGVMKDTAEAGDHFGKVLTLKDKTLGIGVPDENVDGAVDAGAIHLTSLGADDPGTATADVFVSQNTPGVPGGAERDDHFGAAFDEDLLAVGIPGEDTKTVTNAGAIITGIATAGSATPSLRWVTQSTAGIPGKSKPGDRFGSALTSGRDFLCTGQTGIAVGIPGKTVRRTINAGMVTVISAGSTDCGALRGRKYNQNSPDIPGNAVRGNRFGSAFINVPGTDRDAAYAGVPGANLDGKKNTGRVVNAVNLPSTSLRPLGGLQARTAYGKISTNR